MAVEWITTAALREGDEVAFLPSRARWSKRPEPEQVREWKLVELVERTDTKRVRVSFTDGTTATYENGRVRQLREVV